MHYLEGMKGMNGVMRGVNVEIAIWRSAMGIVGRSAPPSLHGAGWFGFETFWAGKEMPKCALGGKNS